MFFVAFLGLTGVMIASPYVRRIQTDLRPECRQGDVMAGVWTPNRLVVHNTCVTATGIVRQIFHANDGDYHINIQLETEYAYLLNDRNTQQVCGWLVVEVTPYDQERGVYIPNVGERVSVTGAWVFDSNHGWNEIHPAWKIERLPGGASGPAPPCSFLLPPE